MVTEEVRIQPFIIDTLVQNSNYKKFIPSNNNFQTFPIYYIGKIIDTIILPKRPIVSPYPKPAIRKKDGSTVFDTTHHENIINLQLNDDTVNFDSLKIHIDTSQLIYRTEYYDLVNYFVTFKHYPVFVYNLSKQDTIFLPRLPAFTVNVITTNETINFRPTQSCGTYNQCLFIPPGQMLLGLVANSHGDTIVQSKVMINGVSSNSFNLELNKEVLNTDRFR